MKPFFKISRHPRFSKEPEGAALVVCLTLIVMTTILLVGFSLTALRDRQSSSVHLAGQEARQFARMGVDVASARILHATSDPDRNWISLPGEIVALPLSDTTTTPESIELSSGTVTAAIKDISVNLNEPALLSPQGLVTDSVVQELAQRWIYVRQDGTHEVAETAPPSYQEGNPVIGRYAFWADDDTSKLNLNTALGRFASNIAPISHPSKIDLRGIGVLTDQEIHDIGTYRLQHLFNTALEPKIAVESEDFHQFLRENKLATAFYNHAPDVSLFNQDRTILSTLSTRAGQRPYFNILKDESNDPGLSGNLDASRTNALVDSLFALMERKDWPVLPGKSLVDRYGALGVGQLILNLIDYVRSAESSEEVVEPVRGSFSGSKFTLSSGGGFIGMSRKPQIVEVAVFVPPTRDSSGAYQCRVKIEIYWPDSFGGNCDLSKLYLYTYLGIPSSNYHQLEDQIKPSEVTGNVEMAPGDRRVITVTRPLVTSSRPTQLLARIAISKAIGSKRLDITPPAASSGSMSDYLTYPVDASTIAETDIVSLAVDDPFLNKHKSNWKIAPHTLGAPPGTGISTLGQASTVLPQQDTDPDGKIVNGFKLPAVGGGIGSVGELGFVHSGAVGDTAAGTPWRTLRFQPRDASDTSLPDWVLLDIFSAPVYTSNPREKRVVQPEDGLRGGVVNLNMNILPFETDEIDPVPPRIIPALALLHATAGGTNTGATARQLGENILDQAPAIGANPGRFLGASFFSDRKLYLTRGQLAEVRGIADQGETSESVIRDLIDHVTTRGSVYSVFSLGESVRQASSGVIHPMGACRKLTIIERTQNGTRIVFQRDLGL